MWAHQYDQQVNQVLATVAKRNWTDNSNTSNIYGQTPHFGCCQANQHQGWPKLVKNMIYGSRDGGLSIALWGPCEAPVKLPAGDVHLQGRDRLSFQTKRSASAFTLNNPASFRSICAFRPG